MGDRGRRTAAGSWISALLVAAFGLAAGACHSGPAAGPPGSAAAPDSDGRVTLHTRADPHRFEPDRIRAAAGRSITVELSVPDDADPPGHTFIQLDTDDRSVAAEVAKAGWNAPDRGFVPRHDAIVAAIEAVEPGASDSTDLEIPDDPDDYLFICSSPGHYPPMHGRLVAEPTD